MQSKLTAVDSVEIVSPSGRFYVDHSNSGLCICDALTGNILWHSCASDPRWPEMQKIAADSGCELTHQIFTRQLVMQQLQCNMYRSHTLVAWGWMPSGKGIVCSTSLHADSNPPALHVYWFA